MEYTLSLFYEKQADYAKSVNHYKKFYQANEAFIFSRRKRSLNILKVQFDIDEKNAKAQLLTQENALQQAKLNKEKKQQTISL
ncbi:hypothetical protein [Aliikangiella maris]|uniref:Uncharacterized protein n=2 Tax=Aliikangiella maris TaxID=3162458 RepID=A0ABV2BU81_9GAMM